MAKSRFSMPKLNPTLGLNLLIVLFGTLVIYGMFSEPLIEGKKNKKEVTLPTKAEIVQKVNDNYIKVNRHVGSIKKLKHKTKNEIEPKIESNAAAIGALTTQFNEWKNQMSS